MGRVGGVSLFHMLLADFILLLHGQNSSVLDSKRCVDNSQIQLSNLIYLDHFKTFTGAMKQNLYIIYYLG